MEKNENGYSEYRFGRNGMNSTRPESGSPSRENGGNSGSCNDNDGAGSGMYDGSFGTEKRQLAMVYSPYQCWRMLYSPENALAHGTLFEELYKPLEECNNGK